MRDQQIEKRGDKFGELFGALVRIGDDDQRALCRLPQQNQVQRLAGRREAGERKWTWLAPQELSGQLLKGRVARQRLEKITNRGMCHNCASRCSNSSTMFVVE